MGVKNLRSQIHYLRKLRQRKTLPQRRKILNEGGAPLVKCLSECCHNLLRGNLKVGERPRHNLKRYAKHIRDVASPKISLKRKKQLLVQHGGFLPSLLVPIISAVAGLAGSLLNK